MTLAVALRLALAFLAGPGGAAWGDRLCGAGSPPPALEVRSGRAILAPGPGRTVVLRWNAGAHPLRGTPRWLSADVTERVCR